MSKVASFTLSSLRSEEVLGFSVEIVEKIKQTEVVAEHTTSKTFLKAILEYEDALNTEKALSYNDLVAADDAVDHAITGLRMHLQALLVYPKDDVRESAREIWNAIDQYGSPTQLNFSEEYAIVKRMLGTLESIDKNTLVTATVDAWVPALRERYDAFMAMMKSYDAERASIVPGKIKLARQNVLDAWRPLCDYINGLAAVSPSDDLDALIGEINVRIQSKKSALKARKAMKKNAKDAASEPAVIEE